MKISWLFIFLFLFSYTQAQDSTNNSSTLGMVQYLDGQASWPKEQTSRPAIAFQTLIYANDQISLDSGAKIKIVTHNLCKGVIYGPATFSAPANLREPWKVNSDSLRWICPEDRLEKIILNNVETQIQGGEILYTDSQLLVRKDLIQSKNNPLSKGLVYQNSSNQWQLIDPQPKDFTKWQLHQDLEIPKESLFFARPKQSFDHRLIFSFGFGGASLSHDEENLDAEDMYADDLYIHYQRRWGKRSLTFGLGIYFSETENRDQDNFNNQQPSPEIFSDVEIFYFDVGIRWNHEKTWAFYTRAGLGTGTFNANGNLTDSNGSFQGFNLETKHNYLVLTAGVEKIFFQETVEKWDILNFRGVYTSIDLRVMQALTSDNVRAESFDPNNSGLPDNVRDGKLLNAALMFHLGLPFGLF